MRSKSFRGSRQSRRGAMLILVALMLVILIVTVVFSVDVAFMQLTRSQLRTATDAAARAGAEALSRLQDEGTARAAALATANKNVVFDQPLELAEEDIVFGRSTIGTQGAAVFVADADPPNAVRVTGRRTADSPSGRVSLFFGKLLGVGSFEPVQTATTMNLDRDIMLVVDRSGSMKFGIENDRVAGGLGNCDPPHATLSRWAALNVAVRSFVEALEETNQSEFLGLASYSSSNASCGIRFSAASLDAPLSGDYLEVVAEMDRYSSIAINGATNIEAGIRSGTAELTNRDRIRPFTDKTMVLLTDGVFNAGNHPRIAAAAAARQDITIHTITFSRNADQRAMQEVAEAAGGKHFHAPDAETLDQIFREIALTLPVVVTE